MLHSTQSWSVGQWVCFGLLIPMLGIGAANIFDTNKPSLMVPFTAVVIVPLVAALIVTINDPVLTAAGIVVPLLVDLGRDQGIRGL